MRAGSTARSHAPAAQLEAVELRDDRAQPVDAGQPRDGVDVLPGEEEAHEVGRR